MFELYICSFESFSLGQNIFVLGGLKSIGRIKPVNMFINISLFS